MDLASQPFGFLNALKPPGVTSTAFGAWLRRLLGGVAVGHWGTLDPAASGVLALAVGKATRLLPLVAPSDKQYAFELVLGAATNTGDSTGEVVARGAAPADWQERLPSVAAGLVGPLEQVPPMFSAVKVKGLPLYLRARRGEQLARAPRTARVYELRVLRTSERSACLLVRCGAGLYVRTLCEELGRRLGTPAHMGALVRTAAGPFTIAQAHLPRDIAADPLKRLIDPLAVLAQPRVDLNPIDAQRFARGNEVPLNAVARSLNAHSPDYLVLREGHLIGTGHVEERDGRATLSPNRVF